METITLRPTSTSASGWTNIANACDGDTSTYATITISSKDYSSKTATFYFNTSSIPSDATITDATLYVRARAGVNNRITLYADINGSSSSRVINSKLTSTTTSKTSNILSYISSLSSVKLTGYMTDSTSTIFTVYDVYIVVSYTEPLATYSVKFVDWDGTVLKSQTIQEGSNATPPSNPSRTGYTFTGWDKGYTNVTSNLTITATYTINTYTVTFKDYNGTVLKTQTVNYGSNATPPSNPTRDGYEFTGRDGAFNNVTSDLIVTAQYTYININKLHIGELIIDKLYIGNSQVNKVYIGETLLYAIPPAVKIYKDTDTSKLKTDETTTKVYIELTNSNFTSRIDEVLQYYPNCTNICFFEDGSVTSLRSMLNGYNTNYKSQITNVTFLDGYFNNVTTMYATFRDCKSLTTVSNIPDSVTNMKQTFYGCTSLIIPPDIPNSVTDMNSTFYNCTLLTTAPNIPNGVTDMESTFRGCTSLTTVPNIGSSVTNMYYTFRGCTSLTTVPSIPSSVTNMNQTFYGCTSLTTVPDIPNSVTVMVGTFNGCTSLTTAPKILSTSVTNINSLYYGCTKLQSCDIPLSATSYSNALRDVPSTCNITWLGERTTDFDVYNTLYYRNANQTDIQELVSGHLANLASSGKSAILTLGSTSLAYLTSAQKTQATNKGWKLQ